MLTQQSLEVAHHDVPVGSPQQLSGTAGQDRQFCPPLPLAGGRLAAACPRLLPPGLIHPTAPLLVHPSKCSNARLRPAIRNNILSATDINDAHVSMRQGTLANYMCTLGFARPPLEGHDYRTSDVLGLVDE